MCSLAEPPTRAATRAATKASRMNLARIFPPFPNRWGLPLTSGKVDTLTRTVGNLNTPERGGAVGTRVERCG